MYGLSKAPSAPLVEGSAAACPTPTSALGVVEGALGTVTGTSAFAFFFFALFDSFWTGGLAVVGADMV